MPIQNALLQAPDVPTLETPLKIILLPALPSQWLKGSIQGARLRGGIIVDLYWQDSKPMKVVLTVANHGRPRKLEVLYAGKVLVRLTSVPGLNQIITNFQL